MLEDAVICDGAGERYCQKNSCEHAVAHHPMDDMYDEETESYQYCDEVTEFCRDVDRVVICIPVSEFNNRKKNKNLKKFIKLEAAEIIHDVFKGDL